MQNIEKDKYWVWLSLIPNLGSVKKQKLLEKFRKHATPPAARLH